MKLVLLFVSGLFFLSGYSQHIEWIKDISIPEHSKREIICDKEGNPYIRANSNSNSVIQKYTKDGKLIWQKSWDQGFIITQFCSNGGEHFYFSGYFSGSHTVDGINLKSEGKEDGMIGEIDSSGTILWINKIQSEGKLVLNSIAVNTNELVVTGYADSNLKAGDFTLPVSEGSVLVATFELNGKCKKAKAFSFPHPDFTYGSNNGIEAAIDSSGNIFLLFDRKGLHPLDPPEPRMGRYIGKLNNNIEFLWSGYVAGSCYYGWKCNRLKADDNGNPYLLNYCSGKYGGNGVISRFNPLNGALNWKHSDKCELGYNDYTFTKSKKLVLIGNEGASIAPAYGSTHGYQVIRIFGADLSTLGETRVYDADLTDVAINDNEEIFIIGRNKRQGFYLYKVDAVACTSPLFHLNGRRQSHLPYYLCNGDTVRLEAAEGFESYQWNTGDTTRAISVSSQGSFSVTVSEASGCISSSAQQAIEVHTGPETPIIYSVTVDQFLQKNKLNHFFNYWTAEAYVSIFKEDDDGNFQLMETVEGSGFLEWIDTASVPDKQADRYQIQVFDTCGFASPLSEPYQTIHLKLIKENDRILLDWTPFQGNSNLKQYMILGGETPYYFTIIDSVGMDKNRYELKPDKFKYFIIEAAPKPYGQWNNSRSNIAGSEPLLVEKESEISVKIFPNPVSEKLFIQFENTGFYHISIHNLLGERVFLQEVATDNYEISTKQFNPGLYVLTIDNKRITQKKKIIIN